MTRITFFEKGARELLDAHGLRDWTFGWMRRRDPFSRAGQCNWKHKTIELQPTFAEVNSGYRVMQTLLHEIAHALKPRHGHNKHWKRQARALGHSGERCYSKNVVRGTKELHKKCRAGETFINAHGEQQLFECVCGMK